MTPSTQQRTDFLRAQLEAVERRIARILEAADAYRDAMTVAHQADSEARCAATFGIAYEGPHVQGLVQRGMAAGAQLLAVAADA